MPLASFTPDADGRVVPYESKLHVGERARRLRLLEAAYHLPLHDLLQRCAPAGGGCELLIERSEAGDEARRLVAEGHLDHSRPVRSTSSSATDQSRE